MKQIHKYFPHESGTLHVLNDISLHVNEGEFVSILGPSGSGKSTLFHMIGGITAPSSGEIYIGQHNMDGISRKGLISYMPQQASLFPWRNVETNVRLGMELNGIRKKDAIKQAREGLAKVGLEQYSKHYPHALSGGMQQRISFLRALLTPNVVMCLDEPFASLDAFTRMDMQNWLVQRWEEEQKTILLITHHIEEALYMSDRIYVLSDKPTSVLATYTVPFPRPRTESLLATESFTKLKFEIYQHMKQKSRA